MTATITARVDSEKKRQAEEIFDDLGMTLSGAISVFINEVVQYSPEPYEEPTYLEQVAEAIADSADVFLEFLADFSIAMIYALPFLVLIAIIIFILVKILKAIIKKHANKPAKEKQFINPYMLANVQAAMTVEKTEEPKAEPENKE